MREIQPFLALERHVTISSLTRTAWACLGHVSLATTNVHAEVDLEIKAKVLADGKTNGKLCKEDTGLMDFLGTP